MSSDRPRVETICLECATPVLSNKKHEIKHLGHTKFTYHVPDIKQPPNHLDYPQHMDFMLNLHLMP